MRLTAAAVVVFAIVLSLFFVWSIGRAFDFEAHCAEATSLCETP